MFSTLSINELMCSVYFTDSLINTEIVRQR